MQRDPRSKESRENTAFPCKYIILFSDISIEDLGRPIFSSLNDDYDIDRCNYIFRFSSPLPIYVFKILIVYCHLFSEFKIRQVVAMAVDRFNIAAGATFTWTVSLGEHSGFADGLRLRTQPSAGSLRAM